MRHLFAYALLPAALLAAAPQRQAAPTPAVYIGPALHISPRHTLADALVTPFPDTYTVQAGDGKKTVRNCTEYLALGDGKPSTGSALDDRTLLSLGVDCEALDWLRKAKPVEHPAVLTFRGLKVSQLPPELALILSGDQRTAAREASQQGKSILAVEPDVTLRVRSADNARLSCPDWTTDLTLYGRGDFLGNGSEQLLVRSDAHATGGTYTATNLFLLQPRNGSLVVVHRYPPAPPA